jgi:hypothetical protein
MISLEGAFETSSSKLCLATMFIHQSDRCRHRKLSEDLDNSFAIGNDDHPKNLVSACHLINEHKNCTLESSVPNSSGVAFAQKTEKGKATQARTRMTWGKQKLLVTTGVARSETSVPAVPSLKTTI